MTKHASTSTHVLIDIMPPNLAYVSEVDQDGAVDPLAIRAKDVFNFTMMADQAFELSNQRYSMFTFFSYVLQSKGLVKSECDQTSVGWFSDKHKDVFGCVIGYKWETRTGDVVVHRPISDLISFEDNVHIEKNEDDSDVSSLDAPFENDEDLVDRINAAQSSWRAHAYPHYKTLSRREMRAKQGVPLRAHSIEEYKQILREEMPVVFNEAHQQIDDDDDLLTTDTGAPTILSRQKDILTKVLPNRFDWRNVKGESFISPVRDQGACGSCFAMATIDALEARIRVQSKNAHKLNLAVQDVISCSPYSQQCSGGYPFAVAKYANDFGVVTEECMRYKAINGTCSMKCKNPDIVARVSSYEYVGGFLQAGNELDMMREIYENGPIVGSFMVHDDFKYYKDGVYTHVAGKAGHRKQSNPIEFTSHSICIIGWDEDETTGEKSWIIKNSWGRTFGEEAPKDSPFWKENCSNSESGPCRGFFRLRRGVDESAIESAAVSFIPKLQIRK